MKRGPWLLAGAIICAFTTPFLNSYGVLQLLAGLLGASCIDKDAWK